MKLAAITPSYNDEALIGACIKGFAPYVQRHIVMVSQKPYFGETEEPDNTAEIASGLGAEVIYGRWQLDHYQRNTAIEMLQEFDWILIADTDVFMLEDDMKSLIEKLKTETKDAVRVNHYPYWKDWEHVIEDTFKPMFAVRPNVRFVHIGNVGCENALYLDVHQHHLSWSEPKDIVSKISHYSHANQIPSDWYEKHFVNWEESDQAVLPDRTYGIRKQSFPKELRELFV